MPSIFTQSGTEPKLTFFGNNVASANSDNGDQIYFQRKNEGFEKSTLKLKLGDDVNSLDKFEIGYFGAGNVWNKSVAIYNNGELWARKVKVTLDNYPDYVFKPDYKLRTLEETEAFIKANQHLPEMPAAADIEKNGADLGELHKAMLKQLEELTLQVISLKKEVEVLKKGK